MEHSDSNNTPTLLRPASRRSVLRAAAWSVPAVSLVTAAPAFAGSTPIGVPIVQDGWYGGTKSSFTSTTSTRYRARFSVMNNVANAVSRPLSLQVVEVVAAGTPYGVDPGAVTANATNTTGLPAGANNVNAAFNWPSGTVTGQTATFVSPTSMNLAPNDVMNAKLDLLINPRTLPLPTSITVTATDTTTAEAWSASLVLAP